MISLKYFTSGFRNYSTISPRENSRVLIIKKIKAFYKNISINKNSTELHVEDSKS